MLFKGHVDPGESDWDTALRETREEAGLNENDMEVRFWIFTYKHYSIFIFCGLALENRLNGFLSFSLK